jgi:hypothetical protein
MKTDRHSPRRLGVIAVITVLLAVVIAAPAKSAPTPTPSATAKPTPTPKPTPTAKPTPTPTPTAKPTPTKKPTPTPRPTPTPTATPIVLSCGPFGDPPEQFVADVIPKCTGGKLLGPSNDSNGTPRYACLYEPAIASVSNPLPLVIFLHASNETADSIQSTQLLKLLATAQVSNDVNFEELELVPNPGFIVLAPEGRDIEQLFPIAHGHGTGFDYWYRQFSPAGDVTLNGTLYKENVDAATIDQFVAQETATGIVDPNSIFITGWATGGAMANLYALSRPSVAAAAPYAAPNAFGALSDTCQQTPIAAAPTQNTQLEIFNPGLPSDQVHSNCDFAGLCPNLEAMETSLLSLGVGVQDTLIDSKQNPANGCLAACGTNANGSATNTMANSTGATNDNQWPTTVTPAMLDFFRVHPLDARPQ